MCQIIEHDFVHNTFIEDLFTEFKSWWSFSLHFIIIQTNNASPLDKMSAISQTTFSNVFSWMKRFVFWFEFHWKSFLGVQLSKSQHWLRWWLGAEQATSHFLNKCWPSSRKYSALRGMNCVTPHLDIYFVLRINLPLTSSSDAMYSCMNCIFMFVNHLKDFLWFTDCLAIGVVISSMKPWSYKWLEFGLFNNISNHPRMCVLSTLCGNVDKHSPFVIYIYRERERWMTVSKQGNFTWQLVLQLYWKNSSVLKLRTVTYMLHN